MIWLERAILIKHNLLSPLKFNDNTFDFIYCSHFIEHLTKDQLRRFLNECYRILKPNGIIRIVTPDFDEMVFTYTNLINSGKKNQAAFVKLEIIDQLVRKRSGGELYDYYSNDLSEQFVSFIRSRTGEELSSSTRPTNFKSFISKLRRLIFRSYVKLICFLLPKAFKNLNVSFADVGELHQWLWSENELITQLHHLNFKDCQKMNYTESLSSYFKDSYLIDLDINRSLPRKGSESMYIEAKK